MTENKDRIADVINRIFSPKTDEDRSLMWTAIGFFAAGALIF